MNNSLRNNVQRLVCMAKLDDNLQKKFLSRIKEGDLTRDENPTSHLCVYFAAYDPQLKLVFIGRHIKSGLWLFNGGHIDKNESLEHALYREMSEEWGLKKEMSINSPSLFTLTKIENPKKQICKWHYDIWYFIPFSRNSFSPNTHLLSKEFFEWGWKSIDEAKLLAKDRATLMGIEEIKNLP